MSITAQLKNRQRAVSLLADWEHAAHLGATDVNQVQSRETWQQDKRINIPLGAPRLFEYISMKLIETLSSGSVVTNHPGFMYA